MDSIYRRITPYKASEEIARQIQSLVKDGTLQPGEKLPSERTLCDLLGVGRSSLREAMNMLEALGLLEIKNRKGIFVRSVGSSLVIDPLRLILEEDKSKLADLYGLRKDVELASAYYAAKLRNSQDLARMKKFLGKMERDARNSHFSLGDDLGYHLAIARAARNFLRMHVIRNIWDLAGSLFWAAGEKIILQGYVVPLMEQHEEVFRAIEKKDQDGARAHMDEHLTRQEETWVKIVTKELQGKKRT
jgi:GntR family transcriptional repressor for pyruvate dehydrogenase complex